MKYKNNYWTISAYSRAFGIDRQTVYRRIRYGMIRTIKYHGGMLIETPEDEKELRSEFYGKRIK